MIKKCKVLHIVYGVDSGGVEAVIYNYYNNIDRDIFHFDIIAQNEKGRDVSKDMFAQKLKYIGASIFYIPPKSEGLFNSMGQCKEIIKKGDYDIVHIHMGYGSLPYVVTVKQCGIKNVIVHNHIAFDKTGWSIKPSTKIMGAGLSCFKTYKMACGRDAANEAFKGKDVYVMNNAVDVTEYLNMEKREQTRKEIDIENHTAICAVARFTQSKNHDFLLDIFTEYLKINSTAKLVLVGTGELQQEIEHKVTQLQLAEQVVFLGARTNIPEILNAMDAFVLPSKFEGFGIVYMEAQLAGLPTLAMEGAVSEAVKISEKLMLVPKDATPEQWAKKINTNIATKEERYEIAKEAKRRGYDIKLEAKKLEEFYMNIAKDK